jgi:hypothetical protein
MTNLTALSVRSVRYWALVLWPGFLSACLLQGLVFALVDPSEVHWSGHIEQPSRQAVYTIAFFCFWSIGAFASAVSLWLARASAQLSNAERD